MPEQNEQDLKDWANEVSAGVNSIPGQINNAVSGFMNDFSKLNQGSAGYYGSLANPYAGNSLLAGGMKTNNSASSMATPLANASGGNGTFLGSPTYVEGGQAQYTAPRPLTMADFMDQYNNLYSQYGTTTGGPSAAVLRSLNQGIQRKNQQYKQNSSSVENMYGQLTQESDAAKQSLLGAYEQAIGGAGERASALQNVLSQEGAAQEAQRARRAAELGISEENALMQYGSQDRLNEAMGSILGQGQSWQGLLESQKLSARQQADRMRTAIGNTKSATKLSLSEAYQNALNNYQSQIAQEKSKVGTRTLNNPFAKALEQKLVEQFNATLPGNAQDKNASAEAAKLNLLSELSGKPVSNAYGQEYVNMLALAREAFSVGGEVTPEEFAIVTRFLSAYGLQPSDLPEATTAKVYNR
jgi:hypothetical protein